MVDPRYFQNTLNSYLGSGFAVQPILTQSAWLRPHNQSEDIPNLYFVGARIPARAAGRAGFGQDCGG